MLKRLLNSIRSGRHFGLLNHGPSKGRKALRIEPLESRHLLSAVPIISEFMADNDNALADGDGNSSDWIELFNAGDQDLDLAGWHLTDDPNELEQWTFPSTLLEAGDYLVVFASGQATADYVDAGGNLHTNFALNDGGDYVALVDPDGETVVSEFGADGQEYPNQREDVSYGIAQDANTLTLIEGGADGDVLIPGGEVSGWNTAGFTPDGSWIQGPMAVGFDAGSGGGGAEPEVLLAMDINARGNPTHTQAGFQPFVVDGGGIQYVDVTRSFGDISVTLMDVNGAGYDDRVRANPVNADTFDQELLLQDFVFSRDNTGVDGFNVFVEGLTAGEQYTIELWSFDDGSTNSRVSDWYANNVLVVDNYTFDGNLDPTANDDYRFSFTATADLDGNILVSGRRDASNTNFAVFLNALRISTYVEPAETVSLLKLDFNDDDAGESGAANTEDGFQTMTLSENGATFDGITVTLSELGGAVLDDRDRATPNENPPAFTYDQIYDDFIFANGTFDGAGMEILIEGLAPSGQYDVKLWSFDSGSGGTRRSEWTELAGPSNGTLVYTFDGNVLPASDDRYSFTATLIASESGVLQLQGIRSGGTSHGVFLNALEITAKGLGELVQTNVQDTMYEQNASAYLRIPFDVPADVELDILKLQMQYDDGFVAYLNGQEVARRNAPGMAGTPPAYNAAATADRTTGEALGSEEINLSAFVDQLVVGGTSGASNVLAIHGLNFDAANEDFILSASLTGTELGEDVATYFFPDPTPGQPNGAGVLDFVADTKFSADRGFYDDPINVAIFTETPGADIYYTTDGSEPGPDNPAASLYTGPVAIGTTTILRAAGYKDQFGPTNVDTQTYIYLDDVLQQNPLDIPDLGITRVEVSPANTVRIDGDPTPWDFPTVNGTSATQWVARENTNPAGDSFGTFGIAWQSVGADNPVLKTTIDGLTPGTEYSLFINYWDADGSAAEFWDVAAGLSEDSLTVFDPDNGTFAGDHSGNRTLYYGALGTAIASVTGTIDVFIDDVPLAPNNASVRTFFDSVGYAEGTIEMPDDSIYPSAWAKGYAADYSMDPDVVNDPLYRDTIKDDLLSIPTMSIVMDHEDLWGDTTGIYNHAESRGDAWQRPASIEYFDPTTGEEFQLNAGVQMHGGASRDNVRLLKHSFRLLFRNDFGPEELHFPLFEDTLNDDFNTLVLRACFTDSFATRTQQGRYSPLDSTYMRDVWMRDSQLAMGSDSGHSTYVHLYINGLYWGLYNPSERPDDAFQEAYDGGNQEDYDIVKDFNELFRGNKTAWNQMFALANAGLASDAAYQAIQGNNPDGTPNPALPNYLDVDNLIDFMILHFYAGAEDWPHHNWYAARDRVGETTGFKFFVWDQEIALDPFYRDRFDVSNNNTPAGLYNALRANAEFRLRFADRAQMHLFNGGALTNEEAAARWLARADEIDRAIVGESARWGDAKEGTTGEGGVIVPTMTLAEWTAERDNVANTIIPQSHVLMMQRLVDADLYPEVSVPEFSQHGGVVAPGFGLTIDAAPTQQFTEETLIWTEASNTYLVPINDDLGTSWADPDFNDWDWYFGWTGIGYEDDAPADYWGLIVSDVRPRDFSPEANSLFVRIPFYSSNVEDAEQLMLKMMYDDGFVAYINGTEVARRNVTDAVPGYDATAPDRPDTLAVTPENIDLSAYMGLLNNGENILAIHVINSSPNDDDMLAKLELMLGTAVGEPTQPDIYYTTDGSDPRLPGGAISDSAVLFDGTALSVDANQVVKARSLENATWSALIEAPFFVTSPAAAGNLAITEINYNPAEPTAAELTAMAGLDNDDFEFVELQNISDGPIDLAGAQFIDGVTLNIPAGNDTILLPGAFAIAARTPQAFQLRYGTPAPVVGAYTGGLSNGGEQLALVDYQGLTIQQFSYNDSRAWPGRADGNGSSLEVLDIAGDYNSPENWRSSVEYGGTPGFIGTGSQGAVVVNEILSHTDVPEYDAIELHNTTGAAINISGWYLSDDNDNYQKYTIPANTSIPAGGYVVFDERQFNPTPGVPGPNDFALNGAHGDDVWLTEDDGSGGVSRFVDHVEFGATANGVTLGRWPNASGKLFPMDENSLGSENTGPLVPDVVISELHYHPADPPAGSAISESDLEFVELFNRSGTTVDMSNWAMIDGVDYTFPTGAMIAANSTAVLVGFDPANTLLADEFRSVHGMDAGAALLGPYDGQLDNSGERVRLAWPDEPPTNEPGFTPLIMADEVLYGDLGDWPAEADGLGKSLTRTAADAFGNFADSWTAEEPSPGSTDLQPPYRHPGDADLSGATDLSDFNIWNANKFKVGTTWATGDFDGNGATDLSDFNIWNAHKFTSVPTPAPVDVALAEAGEYGDSERAEEAAQDLVLLSELNGLTATHRSSQDKSHAEAAVDKLLATYWPS